MTATLDGVSIATSMIFKNTLWDSRDRLLHDRQTDRHTSKEHIISAIHFDHFAEIITPTSRHSVRRQLVVGLPVFVRLSRNDEPFSIDVLGR